MKGEIVHLVTSALQRDMPLHKVLEEVEKAILASAISRHGNSVGVYRGLGIPKSSYFEKKKRYFK